MADLHFACFPLALESQPPQPQHIIYIIHFYND